MKNDDTTDDSEPMSSFEYADRRDREIDEEIKARMAADTITLTTKVFKDLVKEAVREVISEIKWPPILLGDPNTYIVPPTEPMPDDVLERSQHYTSQPIYGVSYPRYRKSKEE